jgi:hypothetical protein
MDFFERRLNPAARSLYRSNDLLKRVTKARVLDAVKYFLGSIGSFFDLQLWKYKSKDSLV